MRYGMILSGLPFVIWGIGKKYAFRHCEKRKLKSEDSGSVGGVKKPGGGRQRIAGFHFGDKRLIPSTQTLPQATQSMAPVYRVTAKEPVYVYLCEGRASKVYHASPDCRGLSRCSTKIYKVTLEKA